VKWSEVKAQNVLRISIRIRIRKVKVKVKVLKVVVNGNGKDKGKGKGKGCIKNMPVLLDEKGQMSKGKG